MLLTVLVLFFKNSLAWFRREKCDITALKKHLNKHLALTVDSFWHLNVQEVIVEYSTVDC